MIRAGKLDRVITIDRATTTIDASGAPQEAWSTVATMRAELVDASADEIMRQNGANSETTITLRTWFTPGVTLADRVTYDGRPFNIKSVKEIGRRRGLEIKATSL